MKKSFFKNIPRQEGTTFEDHAFIIFGKCFRATATIERLPDGTALDHDRRPDGWYLLFNLPFYRIQKYTCTSTFENKEGICYPRLLIRIRKIGTGRYYSATPRFVWVPKDEATIVRYDDPYLSALETKEKLIRK